MTPRTAPRICPLCEATCGLTLVVDRRPDGHGEHVTGARGDAEDVFSHGYICPKGATFPQLDNDPDRLEMPLVRRDGVFVETGWDETLALVVDRLRAVIDTHGGSAVGLYLGNPSAHTLAGAMYAPMLARALGSRNVFSAGTLDQMPKQAAVGYLFGHAGTFAVPDVDRTDHLVVIGANPVVSNGSMTTAADFPGKLDALRHRGGRLTVIDPARTRTARLADTHIAPRPGTDAALLAAVVACLFEEGLVADDLGGIGEFVLGVDQLRREIADLTPERVAAYCDVPAGEIRRLARDIAAAPTAAVYGRMGTSTVEFGTLGSWLIDVVNILTGNLDRPGGVMFPTAPTAPAPRPPRPGKGFRTGRWRSRVSGHPEVAGSCRRSRWSRSWRPRARGGCTRWSPSRAIRCCRLPTGRDWPRHSTPPSSSSASTRISTRPPATPTSSCRRPDRRRARTSTPSSTTSRCARRSGTRRRCCRCRTDGPTRSGSSPG